MEDESRRFGEISYHRNAVVPSLEQQDLLFSPTPRENQYWLGPRRQTGLNVTERIAN